MRVVQTSEAGKALAPLNIKPRYFILSDLKKHRQSLSVQHTITRQLLKIYT